jgi:NTP pyrophosphatase (non-canonical NTP hydrolase)
MTPLEYKQFCETTYACPPGTDREEYLRLLLIEELGEVASLFAKAMRDGVECPDCICDCACFECPHYNYCASCNCYARIYGPEAVNRAALLKELGDVMWCAAMIYTDDDGWLDEHVSLVMDTGRISQVAHMHWSHWPSVFRVVQRLCLNLGFTPEEVATANVEKLKGRRERGTIHGQGDER